MAISDLLGYHCQHCKMRWFISRDFSRRDVVLLPRCLQDPLRFAIVQCWLVACNLCGKENIIDWQEVD